MVEIRMTVFEMDENDKEMVLNDLIGWGAKGIRTGQYNERTESYTFQCSFGSEQAFENFEDKVSENLLANIKKL